MFEQAKAYAQLESKINRELKEILAIKVKKLLGKELTENEIENLMQSGKVKIIKYEDTAPGLFGNPYNLGSVAYDIVDSVSNKILTFEVKINLDHKTLDFEVVEVFEKFYN